MKIEIKPFHPKINKNIIKLAKSVLSQCPLKYVQVVYVKNVGGWENINYFLTSCRTNMFTIANVCTQVIIINKSLKIKLK